MEKKDMALLIEVEDTLADMDEVLEQLAGHGHASGEFIKLDNVFDVIYHNSHTVYSGNPEEGQELFFQILICCAKKMAKKQVLKNSIIFPMIKNSIDSICWICFSLQNWEAVLY